MTTLRVALGQFGAELGEVGRNLELLRGQLGDAAARGAELAVFPELCLSGYLLERSDYTDAVLDAVEEAERTIAADAAATGVSVVYGAPARRGGDLVNAVVLVEPAGRRVEYAKTHMDVKERRVFVRGDEFFVEEVLGVGLACCYDLAFPEPCRILALRGARVLVVPMAWEVERGFVMDTVVAARAVENVAWVVCVNQAGQRGPFRFRGASCAIDPLGSTLVRLGDEDVLEVVDLDVGRVDRLRDRRDDAGYPLLDDRRPDLYEPMRQ
ncbi:MAG TPA: nitrilase-related carbon-nitrogen hydrolase [Gaiellaceae bacterium]